MTPLNREPAHKRDSPAGSDPKRTRPRCHAQTDTPRKTSLYLGEQLTGAEKHIFKLAWEKAIH
jgi:hypothetical protein